MARTKQTNRKQQKKIIHSDSTKFDKSGDNEEHVATENDSSEIIQEGEHVGQPNLKHQKISAGQEKPRKANNRLTHLLQVTFMACESLASVVRAFRQDNIPLAMAQEALLFILKTYFFKESKFEGVKANTRGTATVNFSVPPYVINNYTLSDSLQETIEEAIITLDSYEFESHHKKYAFYKDFTVIANLLDNGFHDNSSISFAFQQQDMGRKPVAGMIYFSFREPNDFIMAARGEQFLKASFPLHSPSRSAPSEGGAAVTALLSADSIGTTIRDNLERSSYTIEDLDNNNNNNNNNNNDATVAQTTLAERFVLLLQGRGSFLVDCRPAISLFGNYLLLSCLLLFSLIISFLIL
jgi:hypothetical protein